MTVLGTTAQSSPSAVLEKEYMRSKEKEERDPIASKDESRAGHVIPLASF